MSPWLGHSTHIIWVLRALCHKSGSPSSGHWKRSILIPIPKKGSTKECPNHQTLALICHASKVMLKILHTRLQSVSSVAQWRSTLFPHGLQHTKLPCPWPAPRAYSNSCPLYQWCHSTISPSVVPFSRFQSFPASGSFQISQFFTSDGQNIGVSASASVLPMNIQDWFPLRWTGWISLQSKGLKSLPQHHSSKASILWCSAFSLVQLSHPYIATGKTIALTRWTLVGKVMSLLFNMLSRLVIAFLPRRKRLLISWLQSSSAVLLEPPKIKSVTVSIVSPSICHEVKGLECHDLHFLNVEF